MCIPLGLGGCLSRRIDGIGQRTCLPVGGVLRACRIRKWSVGPEEEDQTRTPEIQCTAYPFIHHGDLVSATGGGKPVGDEYDGLYALSLFRGGYSTDGLKDLVEMNENVVSHLCPGETETLKTYLMLCTRIK